MVGYGEDTRTADGIFKRVLQSPTLDTMELAHYMITSHHAARACDSASQGLRTSNPV